MSSAAGTPDSRDNARFPGLNVVAQADHWDSATAAVVIARLGIPPDIRFFTPREQATAAALFDQLLDQHDEPRIPVVNMVDARLAEEQTDGWHYNDIPEDGQAWRQTLAYLDADAVGQIGAPFSACPGPDQLRLLQAIHDLGAGEWHGLNASRVWGLWTRYACTAFYSHPQAWNEIGFPGPAYPRGYKNAGIDAREPFEVRDSMPKLGPTGKRTE
jgi:hypothetical protein